MSPLDCLLGCPSRCPQGSPRAPWVQPPGHCPCVTPGALLVCTQGTRGASPGQTPKTASLGYPWLTPWDAPTAPPGWTPWMDCPCVTPVNFHILCLASHSLCPLSVSLFLFQTFLCFFLLKSSSICLFCSIIDHPFPCTYWTEPCHLNTLTSFH